MVTIRCNDLLLGGAMTDELRPQFWRRYTLDELTAPEWEALCDGCGLCCLIKLQDEDSNEIAYTRVACKLLNCQTAACNDYPQRQQWVPDCLQLTVELVQRINWLPSTCAYRRVQHRKPLPNWHYLISGSRQSVIQAKKSAAGRCISENDVPEEEIEQHIVRWVR